MSEKLEFWESVEKTDPNHTKKVNKGNFQLTAVCAYHQIKNATEKWGQFGKNWGVKNEQFNIHETDSGVNWFCASYQAILFYPGCSESGIPIHSDCEVIWSTGARKGKYNDDWTKKIATDALTKGLSKLGFNADIFLGRFDDLKYVEERRREEQKKKEEPDSPEKAEARRLANKYMKSIGKEDRVTLRENFKISGKGNHVFFKELQAKIITSAAKGIQRALQEKFVESKIDKVFFEGQTKLLDIAKEESDLDRVIENIIKEDSNEQ